MQHQTAKYPWWTYLGIVAAMAFVAFWAGQAHAQTACPTAPADPIARDAVRLAWSAVTTWAQSGTIPTPPPVTYSVYELVGTTPTKRCETTALSAGQFALTVGDHTWYVTAKHSASNPANIESAMSPVATKNIPAPPLTPNAPVTFTVTGTITLTPITP